jgi:hypothetical protein
LLLLLLPRGRIQKTRPEIHAIKFKHTNQRTNQ